MPLAQEKHYTYADYLSWDEQERIELIQGQPNMMAPPSRAHQKACGELFRQIANYLDGKKCEAYPAPFTVRLFEKQDDNTAGIDTVVEPGITVICDSDKLDDKGCKGAPDLIDEVVSPSSQRHDHLTKFNLYQQACVREYWLVDPLSKTAQAFVLQDGYYVAVAFGTIGDVIKVHVLQGCFVELERVFE